VGLALLNSGAARYCALVTDINLGDGMNGFELARQAREIDPAFPVGRKRNLLGDGLRDILDPRMRT
jgi:hypothetical protein